jgi:hypothetical protein
VIVGDQHLHHGESLPGSIRVCRIEGYNRLPVNATSRTQQETQADPGFIARG